MHFVHKNTLFLPRYFGLRQSMTKHTIKIFIHQQPQEQFAKQLREDKMKKIIATTLAIISLTSCAPTTTNAESSKDTTATKSTEARDIQTIARDDAITATINAKYLRDNLIKVVNINVDTYKGAVKLTGSVTSNEAKLRAIGLAETTKGVVSVNGDNLKVID